jgi:ATP-dependent DNA helicase RecQ
LEKAGFPVKVVLEKSFPIHRVREIVVFIDYLKNKEEEVFRTSQLIDQYFSILKDNELNVWINLIHRFLMSYQDETSDAILPAGWLIDKFYEYVSEQQREKVIGEGIFLGTIHSAKGMEFSHVFVLDGDWNIPNSAKRWEEERRILYVAMTRAKESLVLMAVANKPNPFLKELKGQSVLRRKSRASLETYDCESYYQYEILGLEDIFIDYAGGFNSNHLIHKQLSKIGPGDELFFVDTTRHVEVHDCDKCCVCRLAKKNTDQWRKRIKNIHKLRVLSVLVRGKNDPDIKFDKWVKTDSWELPIIEVVMRD